VVAGLPADLDRIVFRALEKDRELRYQSAADLRADLRRLRKAVESGRTSAVSRAAAVPAAAAAPASPAPPLPPGPARSRRLRWMVAAPVVTVAVVAAVLFSRSAGTPALASRDRMVLAGFVNRTGDPMFDDTLGEALGVQLRQSPFLNVLNEQQQQSTLRLMGREPASPVTIEIGQEVCQPMRARRCSAGASPVSDRPT
jgi:eukaryotic-like serine/threonine-protein kinase